jgi:hypothetical protein
LGSFRTAVTAHVGWRPFEYITLQPPTGVVERFIPLVTEPVKNAALGSEMGENDLCLLQVRRPRPSFPFFVGKPGITFL